jgi:hypothetical protein
MTNRPARLLTLATAAAIFACAASAQVVTPPPGQAPNPADHIPKAPPPPPAPPPRPAPPPVTAKPVKPQVVLPELPYEKLLKLDDKGEPMPLAEAPDFAALKRNPMVKPEDLHRIEPYLKERRSTFERIVIDNLDLVEQIDDGLFESVDLTDGKNFSTLLNTSKPLRDPATPKAVHQELQARGLLTPEQAAFNEKIAKEYMDARLPPEPRRKLAMMYKRGVEEPLYVRRDLLLETSRVAEKILPELGLDQTTLSRAQAKVKSASAAKTDAERLAAMEELSGILNLDQRKDLLRRVVQSRPQN